MLKQFRHRLFKWMAWMWQDERAAMKWYKKPQAPPCMELPPSFDYVPRFKSGFLAHLFSNGHIIVGKEINRGGSNHLAYPDGTHVDTDKLFKPVDWWMQQ